MSAGLDRMGALFAAASKWLRTERGNVAALMALALVPMIGAISMGVEASSWFFMGRSAQNAADSAAVAAANNAGSSAASEGQANAQQYGFLSSNVAISSGAGCPDGTSNCYQAIVTRVVPIYLTRFVGFNGDTDLGGGKRGKTITAIAKAEPLNAVSFPSCITAVGSDAASPGNGSNQQAITGSGTPNSNAPNCTIAAVGASPSSISCSGSAGLGSPYGFATGSITGSGSNICVTQTTTNSSFVFCDPYAAAPASGCTAGTLASAVAGKVSSTTTECAASGSLAAVTGDCTHTGNLTLTGNLNPSNPAVVVIKNGNLTMGNYSSNNITFIFAGSSPGTLASSSNVNLTAPSDPTLTSLSGVATYQVATATCTHSACDTWNETGNYTVNVTGLLYMPYTNANFGGSAGTSSTGKCLVSVFNSFATNGTGYVLDQTGCKAAGLGSVPTVLRYRAALVQ